MKPIKRIASAAIVICMFFGLGCTTFAKADAAAETATSLIVLSEGLESAYDASVISRMAGRAGAAAPSGAKGIAFEIMLADKLNIKDIFKSGTKTELSASSTDPVADLVTTVRGEVERLIQCKSGTSVPHINSVLKDVESGKYASAELVGTKEFAHAFNEKALSVGVEQLASDSGISVESAGRVADKSLGLISPAKLAPAAIKAAKIGGATAAALSVAESIAIGDDFSHAAGNAISNAAAATISTALCPLTEAAMIVLLSSFGVSATAAAVSGTVVRIIVPCAAGYVLCMFFEEANLKETIAAAVDYAGDKLTKVYEDIAGYVSDLDIQSSASQAKGFIVEKLSAGTDFAKDFFSTIGSAVSGSYSKAVSFFKSIF